MTRCRRYEPGDLLFGPTPETHPAFGPLAPRPAPAVVQTSAPELRARRAAGPFDPVRSALDGAAALLSREDPTLGAALAALSAARASGEWAPAVDALAEAVVALRDRATAQASDRLEARRLAAGGDS